MEDSNEGDVSPGCSSPLQIVGGPALSDSRKLEPLAHFTLSMTLVNWQLLGLPVKPHIRTNVLS